MELCAIIFSSLSLFMYNSKETFRSAELKISYENKFHTNIIFYFHISFVFKNDNSKRAKKFSTTLTKMANLIISN